MRILVVEDDAVTGSALESLLRRRGHLVEWAGSMGTAEMKAVILRPEVVMLDLGLPDCRDAQESLGRARMLPGGPRVMVLTAMSREELPPLRASSVLIKPAEPEEIVAQVELAAKEMPC